MMTCACVYVCLRVFGRLCVHIHVCLYVCECPHKVQSTDVANGIYA